MVDALTADVNEISRRERGTQTLQLDAGPTHAGQEFLMLGSLSGTEPGFHQGEWTIPINPDFYTLLLMFEPRQAPISPVHGYLDGSGKATVTFEITRRWNAATLVGHTFNHAFVLLDRHGRILFVSNAEPLTIRR